MDNQPSSHLKKRQHTHYPNRLPHAVMPLCGDFTPLTQVIKHAHPWSQLAYSSRGVLHIETEQGLFVVPPQQALWLPPNVTHQISCLHPTRLRSLHFQAPITTSLGADILTLSVSPLLQALILEVCDWGKGYQLSDDKQRLIDVLVDQLAAAKRQDFFIPNISDKRLQPIINHFNHQPDSKQTLQDFAKQVGASTRTLHRLFVRHFAMGFNQWKQRIRIMKALALLEQDLPIKDIAATLGYDSDSSFIAAFKQQMGQPPKQYRQHN
ncbi:AraC family transcriptional regulator [Pseudoalteromonas ulvae]|uniref:AraC family transcriptional regulator n=1 Tax=Pseudoalteromonas ulvae TaxID=107327 RepID=UPI00186BA409|nr:helix-turn-helix transcriptional regulator [Pseudoalteromonas ulvae]